MKRPEHIKAAKQIGADSWVLLNYVELPRNASAARQIEALTRDQHWQEMHHYEVSSRIDRLIADIESNAKAETSARSDDSSPAPCSVAWRCSCGYECVVKQALVCPKCGKRQRQPNSPICVKTENRA